MDNQTESMTVSEFFRLKHRLTKLNMDLDFDGASFMIKPIGCKGDTTTLDTLARVEDFIYGAETASEMAEQKRRKGRE